MKTIGIYPNTDKDVDFLGTVRVIGALQGKAEILADESLRESLTEALGGHTDSMRFVPTEALCAEPEAMVVLWPAAAQSLSIWFRASAQEASIRSRFVM